jgi:hypothetical protein
MIKNVQIVDHKELLIHLDNSYDRKLPLFVWGRFGIGKSQMIREFGKRKAA